jgi:hypothetical protein
MSILYTALAIYVIGAAIVLYIRPSIMFHPEKGTWKEFGIDTSHRSTIFPFWMFAILWAFVSYAIATIINVGIAHTALNSSANEPIFYEESVALPISRSAYSPANNDFLPARMHVNTPYPSVVPTPSVNITPSMPSANNMYPSVSSSPSVSTGGPTPGYYIVEPPSSGNNAPRFVYFGPEPPTYSNLAAYSR